MPESRAVRRWPIGLLVAVAALIPLALLLWGRPLYELLHAQEQIRTWVEEFGLWGPLVIVLLEVAQVLLAPIPGQAIELVSGYLFGPWLGALYAMGGITIGAALNFLLARTFGRPLLARLVKPETLDRLDDLAQRGGALFFFLLWLFPLVPDDLACLAAGLTPMPLRQFLLLMILGRFPGIMISTWAGAQLTRINPTWWAFVIVALAVAAFALWKWGDTIQETLIRQFQRWANRLR